MGTEAIPEVHEIQGSPESSVIEISWLMNFNKPQEFSIPHTPLMVDLRVNEDETLKLTFAASAGTCSDCVLRALLIALRGRT